MKHTFYRKTVWDRPVEGGTGWAGDALCFALGMDPELFFSDESDAAGNQAAKQVCGACPVRVACLEAAPEFGVWGGLTETERRTMRRRTAKIAARRLATV